MTTHAAVAASRRRAARRSRRSPSSPAASATRWCATWARSAARSPTTIRRPDYPAAVLALGATIQTDRRTHRRRRLLHRPVRDGARARRADHRGELPGRAEGRLREVQAAGVALRAGRRVRRADGAAACASRSPAPRADVFRATALEHALAKSFTPDAAKAVQMPADGLNADLHGSAEYRAATDQRDGRARGRGGARALIAVVRRAAAERCRRPPRAMSRPRRRSPSVDAVDDARAPASRLRRRPAPRDRAVPRPEAAAPAVPRRRAGRRQDRARQGAGARRSARQLLRVQCYEGLDIAQTAYEWNFARQMIEIRLAEAAHDLHDAGERERLPTASTRAPC